MKVYVISLTETDEDGAQLIRCWPITEDEARQITAGRGEPIAEMMAPLQLWLDMEPTVAATPGVLLVER